MGCGEHVPRVLRERKKSVLGGWGLQLCLWLLCPALPALICRSGSQKRAGNVTRERWSCFWPDSASKLHLRQKKVMGESLSNLSSWRVLNLLLTYQYLYRQEEGELQPPASPELQKNPNPFQAMEKLLPQHRAVPGVGCAWHWVSSSSEYQDSHVLLLSRWCCTHLTSPRLSNTQGCCSCLLSLQITSLHHPH